MKTEEEIRQEIDKLYKTVPEDNSQEMWIQLGMINALNYVLETKEYKSMEDTLQFKLACERESK